MTVVVVEVMAGMVVLLEVMVEGMTEDEMAGWHH